MSTDPVGPAAPHIRRALPAGLTDAGCASVTTLAVALIAARRLQPDVLGAYAVCFTAFQLLTVLPNQLVLLPAEIAALDLGGRERLSILNRTLRLGGLTALPSALAMFGVVMLVPDTVPRAAVWALASSGAAAAFVSPLQDHVRRLLHLGGVSWEAAAVSVVQLLTAAAALAAMLSAGVKEPWIPFGSLAAANVVSLTVGLARARKRRVPVAQSPLRWADLVRAGRWLTVVGLAPAVSGFLAVVVVARLAGAAAVGYAEAARVVGRPLAVLSTGLTAVVGPRAMEAAAAGDAVAGHRIRRSFVTLVAVTGAAYIVLAGPTWSWSPLPSLLPNAYVIPWLTAATVASSTINAVAFSMRAELQGARREAPLARTEVASSGAEVAVSATAAFTGAFALPFGHVLQGVWRLEGFRRLLLSVYQGLPNESRRRVDPPEGPTES